MASAARQERIDREVELFIEHAPKDQAELRSYISGRLIDLQLAGVPEADRVVIEDRVRAIFRVPQ